MRAGTVSPLQERVGALEPILAAERQCHTETRHLLQRAELRVRGLEARTLSDAVAQAEALDVERRAVINAQRRWTRRCSRLSSVTLPGGLLRLVGRQGPAR